MSAAHVTHARWILLALAAAVVSLAEPAPAAAAEALDQSEARNGIATWSDRQSIATIDTRRGDDVVRQREAELRERAGADGEQASRMDFKRPADVHATAFLRLLDDDGREQLWIWTPQARRARQLPADQADESGYGAELSYRDYEDLLRAIRLRAAAKVELVAPPPAAGEGASLSGAATVVEIVPPAPVRRVARYRLWLAGDGLRIEQADLLDAEGKLMRRIRLRAYERDGNHASPTEIEIGRPGVDTTTVIRLSKLRYDTGIPASVLSIGSLMKGE